MLPLKANRVRTSKAITPSIGIDLLMLCTGAFERPLSRVRCPEVGVKECRDTASRVKCGLLVVGDAGEAESLEPESLMVVHERMGGLGVLLDVVCDTRALQC